MTTMPRHQVRAGWILAIALGVILGLRIQSCGMDNAPDAQELVTLGREADVVTGTSLPPGRVLASGVVKAADHEMTEGYFSIDHLTVLAPPQGAASMVLRDARFNERRYELVLREIK